MVGGRLANVNASNSHSIDTKDHWKSQHYGDELYQALIDRKPVDPLTDRETEILRLMASGFSNKEIANSLGVAEGTIKNHVSNILSKLGVRDRTRAVLKAFELQLI